METSHQRRSRRREEADLGEVTQFPPRHLGGYYARGLGRAFVSFQQRLNAPVDIASLAAFRILFGLLMAFAMVRFLANGWVDELYVKPTFFFSYEFFPWAKPLPRGAMHALFPLLSVLALFVAIGFCYRFSIALFFI